MDTKSQDILEIFINTTSIPLINIIKLNLNKHNGIEIHTKLSCLYKKNREEGTFLL